MRIVERISRAMRICGIDPGVSGAIALLEGDQLTQVLDMPVFQMKTKRVINAGGISTILREMQPDHVFLELVWTRPGESPIGAFSFGEGVGMVRGACAALLLPITQVSPQRWKAALKVPAAKDGARSRASQLMPRAAGSWQRVKDDGRAEAALIALWGYRMGLGSGAGNTVIDW